MLTSTQFHDWINGAKILDDRTPPAIEINKSADLETRYDELGQVCQEMDVRLSGAAFLLMALFTRAVRTIDALREKLTAESNEEGGPGFAISTHP